MANRAKSANTLRQRAKGGVSRIAEKGQDAPHSVRETATSRAAASKKITVDAKATFSGTVVAGKVHVVLSLANKKTLTFDGRFIGPAIGKGKSTGTYTGRLPKDGETCEFTVAFGAYGPGLMGIEFEEKGVPFGGYVGGAVGGGANNPVTMYGRGTWHAG